MNSQPDYIMFLNRLADDPSALNRLSPRAFEGFVANLLTSVGYEVTVTPATGNGGIDMIATLKSDVATLLGVVECKRYNRDRPVGVDVVRQLDGYAEEARAAFALLVTNTRVTKQAYEFLKHVRNRVQVVDRDRLLALAAQARGREDTQAESIAFRLQNLPFETVGVVHEPSLGDPSRIVLPEQFEKRIIEVKSLPLQLLKALAADPRHLHALTPRQFEEFVAELVDGLGFADVVLTPRSYDGGKDVIASKIVEGIPLMFYFECKKYADGNKVQLDTLRALLGVVAHDSRKANIGVLVTTSRFTKGANDLILSECRLDGKDYDGITGWISEYSRRHSPLQLT